MQTLHEFSRQRNRDTCCERFADFLPHFLLALETEWRQSGMLMDLEQRFLVRTAHQALGAINERLGER